MARYADLAGKTAIVTGGSVGIGAAICRALAENGVDVAVVARQNRAAAEQVAADAVGLGTRSFAMLADVTQPADVEQMVAETTARLGWVDILVNNAGGHSIFTSTVKITPEEWGAVLMVNLTSCFLCSRAVLPPMIERRWGRIVNISSVSGRMPQPPSNPAYAAAKAGMIGFTRHLALEVVQYGITVNATAPGTTWTPRAERNLGRDPERRAQREATIPMGRLATSEEQAGIVVFLASEEARYITGVTVDVAGGKVMT